MVAPWKKDFVKRTQAYLEEYPVVGVVDLRSLPAPQMQEMREKFRDSLLVVGGRKNLMKRALENSKQKNVAALIEHLNGLPALIFSKENAFSLYNKLQKNKSAAPAKAGQIAPKDIVIPAGNTGLNPGPINSELGMLGIKPGVENGKVVIKEDKVVAKEGDVISANLAGTLMKLKIEPMEIGLNISVLLEEGTLFDKKTLYIDEEEFMGLLTSAHQQVMNMALNVGILMPETTELLISKAFNDAKALARSQKILISEVVGEVLSQVEGSAQAVLAEGEKAAPQTIKSDEEVTK